MTLAIVVAARRSALSDPGRVDLECGGAAAAVAEAVGDGAEVDAGGDEFGGVVVAQ